jgi:hypothetical protein
LIGTKTVSFTAKVPSSVVPSISSLTVAEAVSGLSTKFGAYVQNKSKLKVTISAAGSYSSTIKTYKTTIAGKSYTASSFTSGVLTSSGTVTISCTVTDSRGRTASKSSTVSVLAYTAPKITKFSAFRANADGTQNYESTSVSCAYAWSVSALGNKNNNSYIFEYKAKSASTWNALASGNSYSINTSRIFSDIAPIDSSYDLRLTVTDYFGSVVALAEVPTAFTLLDFHSGGKGIAFGKVSEFADQMELNMETSIYKDVFMGGKKRSNDEKNMYFQTADSAANVHNCKLYGANGDSVTSIGCWDSARNHGIWRYLTGTQNLVFDANVKVTRANGGDEFVTSDPVVHGSRTGKAFLSNGLLIQWGETSVTPTAANTPTSKTVSFSTTYTDNPIVMVTMLSTAPGISVTGVAAGSISTTGFNAYVTRTNTTSTTVMWLAIGYKA